MPGRRPIEGTDLEIAYNLLGDDLILRVNKSGVQVFGVVLENAAALVVGSQSFSDPRVVVMVIVIAIVGLIILMPLSRALANR